MDKLQKDLRDYLARNYFWNGEEIVSREKLKALFEAAHYSASEELLDFMGRFCGCLFKFSHGEQVVDVDFRLKRVLKNNRREYFVEQTAALLGVEDVTPFGEIDHGHMTLTADPSGNLYAVADDYVMPFGNDYWALLDALYRKGYSGR